MNGIWAYPPSCLGGRAFRYYSPQGHFTKLQGVAAAIPYADSVKEKTPGRRHNYNHN